MGISKVLVWVHVMCFFLLVMNNNNGGMVEASHKIFPHLQSVMPAKVVEDYRTGYHFQPKQNWMNDPNGPMYYNGIYHFFYQYNPKGAVWGNMVWAHSISTDLVNWIPITPAAIYPSKPFDINGCWSGSATILPGNRPAILYTGIDSQNRQVQNVAYPKNLSDPFLTEWEKPDYNPIMQPTPANGINMSAFRDPSTAWYNNGHWKLLVGTKRGNRGLVLVYRSRDFITWTKAQHPLHSAAKIGMWECPDFFPVSLKGKQGLDWSVFGNHVKHVLKVSLDNTRFEYYTVGKYFDKMDRYIPDNTSSDDATGLRFDYGNFYASKTFFDDKNKRRILWGWANESDTTADDVEKGWAGVQLIPRTLLLDKSGKQLVQWPIKEIETLRREKIEMNNVPLAKGQRIEVQVTTASQADVEVTFQLPSLKDAEEFDPSLLDAEMLCGQKNASVEGGIGPFGLLTLASEKLEEYTAVFFQVFRSKQKHVVLMCSGGKKSSLRPEVYKPSFGGFVDVDLEAENTLSLRSLIDHSVVESFGAGGKTCITSRVYPSLALGEHAHLYIFNNGTDTITMKQLNAWSMDTPNIRNN